MQISSKFSISKLFSKKMLKEGTHLVVMNQNEMKRIKDII